MHASIRKHTLQRMHAPHLLDIEVTQVLRRYGGSPPASHKIEGVNANGSRIMFSQGRFTFSFQTCQNMLLTL
jgi:hypothetical protein